MLPTAKNILTRDFQMPVKLQHLYSLTMMGHMKEYLDTVSLFKDLVPHMW